ncbi:MAG TPA: TolC family protein [Desulfobulbus sp.]|nr:TolC family protein [Desulfobulbus sp.]
MYSKLRLTAAVMLGLFFLALPVAASSDELQAGKGNLKNPLSLQDALQRIFSSPALKAASENVAIQNGLLRQAGLLPNPFFTVEVENFGGRNEFTSFDSAETTLSVNQLIELGGKRGDRKSLAAQEKSLTELDFQIRKQDLVLETMKAFSAVLAAQERLNQATQLLELAEKGFQTVIDRIEAGKVSPVQKLRASVEKNMARNALEGARRELVQARLRLAALWGDPEPGFGVAVGAFGELQDPPDWKELQSLLQETPDVKRWETELFRKRAKLSLERANSIPDVTLSFGVRNFSATDEEAFVAGMEVPLSVFDRNQGGREAAQAGLSQALARRDAEIARLSAALRSTYQKLLSTYRQARTIKQEIMPAAEQANEATQIGYREGKFDFLEALDAQRTLFDVKARYIDAFSAYHEARLNVMRLAGRITSVSF